MRRRGSRPKRACAWKPPKPDFQLNDTSTQSPPDFRVRGRWRTGKARRLELEPEAKAHAVPLEVDEIELPRCAGHMPGNLRVPCNRHEGVRREPRVEGGADEQGL